MNITTAQVKEIRLELAKLKPVKVNLDGNRSLTVKEAIFALAPTLERMKKRDFDTQEIAEKLHEKGIEVKPPTLAKYMNEFRRGKGQTEGQWRYCRQDHAGTGTRPAISGTYHGKATFQQHLNGSGPEYPGRST